MCKGRGSYLWLAVLSAAMFLISAFLMWNVLTFVRVHGTSLAIACGGVLGQALDWLRLLFSGLICVFTVYLLLGGRPQRRINIAVPVFAVVILVTTVLLFWNLGVFVDEFNTSPAIVYGSEFGLRLDWLRLPLAGILCVFSLVPAEKSKE